MAQAKMSYGFEIDRPRCAEELRSHMRDRGLQVIHLANVTGGTGLLGHGTYFNSCYQLEKSRGEGFRLLRFMNDIVDEANDGVLCVGGWRTSPATLAYAVFAYEGDEEPNAEMLALLARSLAHIASGSSSSLTLEGLASSSEVSFALRQLARYYDGDWGAVSRRLSGTGELSVGVQLAGPKVAHVVSAPPQDKAPSEPAARPSEPAKASAAAFDAAAPIPGFPPHAYANKDAAASRRQVEELVTRIWVGAWPKRCEELRELTGREGPDDEVWLAIVAKQFDESRIVEPQGAIPGHVKLPRLFDCVGRPIFAILRASADPSDLRLTLEAFMDHDQAASVVPIGISPKPNPAFHTLDRLAYLCGNAERHAAFFTDEALDELVACVREGRPVPAKALKNLARYGEMWAGMRQALEHLEMPVPASLAGIRAQVDDWSLSVVRREDRREALREVVEGCSARFSSIVSWGNPRIDADLALLDGSDIVDEKKLQSLCRVYEALVEEMMRDEPYGERGMQLELVEKHLGKLGGMFDVLRASFAQEPVSLERLRRASGERVALGAGQGAVPEPAPEPVAVTRGEAAPPAAVMEDAGDDGDADADVPPAFAPAPVSAVPSSSAAYDEDPFLNEIPSFNPDLAADLGDLAAADFDGVEDLAAPVEPVAAPERQEAALPEASLREECAEDYRRGAETGIACNFSRFFELGEGGMWPAPTGEPRGGVFLDCALLGRRSLDDVMGASEAALADGVRPAHAHRILDAARDRAPIEPSSPGYQRFWALMTLADRLGFAAGTVPLDRLVEDCEYLTLGDEPLSLDPARACLLSEAFLAVITAQLSGRTVGMFQDYLALLDEKDARLGALHLLSGSLERLLSALRSNFSYDPSVDYTAITLSAMRALRRDASLEGLKARAEELRSAPGSSYVPATSFWRRLVARTGTELSLRVKGLLDDLSDQTRAPSVRRDKLVDLMRDLEDNLDHDYRAYWEEEGRYGGSHEPLISQARAALIERIKEIYRCYGEYLDLLALGSGGRPSTGGAAEALAAVQADVRTALKTLDAKQRGSWDTLVDMALGFSDSYPAASLPAEKPLSADLSESALPADLRTPKGLALVELMVHAELADEKFDVPNDDELAGRAEACLEMVERAFAFNVIGGSLRATLRGMLARAEGVANAVGGFPQGERATHAMLARWALELVEARVDDLCKGVIARAAQRLEASKGLDERARSLLRGAIESGNLARVFAYADYEIDKDVFSIARPAVSYEDEFYGYEGDEGRVTGLIDPILRGLATDPQRFSFVNLPFAEIGSSSASDQRAEGAYDDYGALKKAVGGLKRCLREHALPVNGGRLATAGEQASSATVAALKEFSRQLAELFKGLGFVDARVAHAASYAEADAPVSSWRLRFFSSPAATDGNGRLVCPLREFLVPTSAKDEMDSARITYDVSVFTDYDALMSAMKGASPLGSVKRLALYLAMEPSDLLTPQERGELMPARWMTSDSEGLGMMLLDEVLIAYLATVPSSGQCLNRLAAFFHCALPFTAPHPYGDNAMQSSGGVTRDQSGQPPLFYGRGAILRQLEAGRGATFIYGARRLGKTSIMREFAAEQRARRHNPNKRPDVLPCVAYVDMNGFAGMDLDNFWLQFVGRSFQADVPELSGAMSADDVRSILSEASRSKEFFLLLDEADDLLRFDSVPRIGHDHNAIMDSLVRYMEGNDRFRVVVGGLHATMRYVNQWAKPNQTRGQLGVPVVVGPLWDSGSYLDAVRLVREPLKMMGYLIRRDDLLTILSKACYFPNLINIICELLLVKLRSARGAAPSTSFYVEIPQNMVEGAVREATATLRQAFGYTIELDPGYQMIVDALWIHEEESARRGERRRAFTSDEIRRRVREIVTEGEGRLLDDRELVDSGLLGNLQSDIEELETFGILKHFDEGLITLRDGSMRSLAIGDMGYEGALSNLRARLQAYLERDVLNDRFAADEARNVVSFDGFALFSPLNSDDVLKVSRRLGRSGLCVLVAGELAGSEVLARRFSGLLPGLCRGGSPVMVDGARLPLLRMGGLPAGLVVVTDGWGIDDLRGLREAGTLQATGTRVLLMASPRTAWALREELADRDDVVCPTPWSEWTRLAWTKNYTEHFEQSTAGTIEPRMRGDYAWRMKLLCGGQAGAVAKVARAALGSDDMSPKALLREMRSFSRQALAGPDFGWVAEGAAPGSETILEVWRHLAGFADPEADHPLADAYPMSEWTDVLGDVADERSLEDVLRWMVIAGLARWVGDEAEPELQMLDWFMNALLASPLVSDRAEGGESR